MNLADNWPLLQCERQLSCSVEVNSTAADHPNCALAAGPTTHACAASNAACDKRSCSRCTSHNVKNSSVDERALGLRTARSGTTATEQPCCCGMCSLPGTRRCCGGTLPPRARTTCWTALAPPRPSNSSLADDPAGDTTCAMRHGPKTCNALGTRLETHQHVAQELKHQGSC